MIGQSQPVRSQPTDVRRPAPERATSSYLPEEAVGNAPVDRPITPDEVWRLASAGYPLWEPLEVMQLRNRRITVGYSDLSERLAALLAQGDDQLDANWCTFATWSSRTIGTWIERDAHPEPLLQLRAPKPVKEALIRLTQWLLQRENGATYRCLAAGNRFVFLEIAQATSTFLEHFSDAGRDVGEKAWEDYWAEVRAHVEELRNLDPSWLLTEAPPPDDLRLGLRQYFEALRCEDRKRRAEHILAGNLLMGGYEQRRVDGYVAASIALFTERAMRNLVRHRSGALRGTIHWWPSMAYARLMTRGLVYDLPGERLQVSKPLPPPPDGPLFPPDLQVIELPLLQALLTRWDTSDGRDSERRARNWALLDDRMNYIANLFRSRQQRQALLTERPFPADVENALLAGKLDPGPTERIPSGGNRYPVG
ncbi:MAG TPA: hypothetical protein VIL48_22525 [Acidimicrobiales bacterium]